MTDICLIILNYNGLPETKELVESLKSWDEDMFSFRAIVVDNCSTDQSFEQLLECFSSTSFVDVIRSEKNGGYSYGNNYGARYAIEKYTPQYLAIANPDIQIDQDTMIELLKTFQVDEKIAMAAPAMKNTKGEYRLYSQRLPTFYDDFRACWTEKASPSIITKNYETVPEHENLILTEMLHGSFYVVKTSCFQEAGMLDEGVFLFCEERIIGKRLKDLGYKLILRSDLFFVHAHSVTIRKAMNTLKMWRAIWNSRIYYQKKYNRIDQSKIALLRFGAWYFHEMLAIKLRLHDWKQAMKH